MAVAAVMVLVVVMLVAVAAAAAAAAAFHSVVRDIFAGVTLLTSRPGET